MVRMVAKLCVVLSGLLVASLGGCSGGNQAGSRPDASAVAGGSGGSAGAGGGGSGGQPATATSATPGVCVPGASVACACVTGQQGAQTCTAAGTFAACACVDPTADAGGGSSGPRPIDPTAFAQDYKFVDNEISGWTQDPASDGFWAGTDLIAGTSIDGAAQAYTDQGFVQGMFQNLDGPNAQFCTVRAMDFGTAAHATAMYASAKTTSITQSTAIPTYDLSIAIGNAAPSGLSVYAHFGASYFEVFLSGLGDQRSTCMECPVAQQFLDVLKQESN